MPHSDTTEMKIMLTLYLNENIFFENIIYHVIKIPSKRQKYINILQALI